MSEYVMAFRSRRGHRVEAPEEAEWAAWMQSLRAQVVDSGNRTHAAVTVSAESIDSEADQGLSGYFVVDAETTQHAIETAPSCPGLSRGGQVEVAPILS
jgi:hypothetical protein